MSFVSFVSYEQKRNYSTGRNWPEKASHLPRRFGAPSKKPRRLLFSSRWCGPGERLLTAGVDDVDDLVQRIVHFFSLISPERGRCGR
jgi:hypothetical protein